MVIKLLKFVFQLRGGNYRHTQYKLWYVGIVCFLSLCSIDLVQAYSNNGFLTTSGVLPSSYLDKFAQNNIMFYEPCSGSGSGSISSTAGGCAKLGELRRQMWESASDEDKENFMTVVSEENPSLAGVEGFMNQVIARSNGDLYGWIRGLCPLFRGHNKGGPDCFGSHTITEKEQKWIDKALGGSNVINFATGNSSWYDNTPKGDAPTGGPLTCFWISSDNEDGGECKSDIDYSLPVYSKHKEGTMCSDMIKAAGGSVGNGWECWAWDNTEKWSGDMAKSSCGGSNSAGSTDFDVDFATSSIEWDTEGWIIGGMDGYKKDAYGSLGTKYDSGKPNKILLHYTQGSGIDIDYNARFGKSIAPHFTIDLLKKQVHQHYPLSIPSGAVKDSADVMDIVQIEIVGYGFDVDNPDSPDEKSICKIRGAGGGDFTSSEYCFAKFGDDEWKYLADLLKGISNWAKENGGNIPLTSSATWTGDTEKVRMSEEDFKKTKGIVAHMHAPYPNDHLDTGNIWPMVKAALGGVECNLNGDEDSVSGAKNAEKSANEVGVMSFGDNNTAEMRLLLENYGDLAFRTGKAYGIPWVAILVQGRYEDSGKNTGFEGMCGVNNFWGMGCPPGTKAGNGLNFTNLGEGFKGYGKFVHNGNYEDALKETDPYEYLKKLGPMWVQGNKNGEGYKSINSIKKSIEALTKYIESEEGQKVVAEFGAAGCSVKTTDICGNTTYSATGDVAALQDLVKKYAYPTYVGSKRAGGPQPAYEEAMKTTAFRGASSAAGKDCSAFVYNVIFNSGWDPKYPAGGTLAQIDYLSNPKNGWVKVTDQIKSADDGEPGDVIICNVQKGKSWCGSVVDSPYKTSGHVVLYVGKIDGFGSRIASASLNLRWPEADYTDDISDFVLKQNYDVYRKVK